MPKKKTKKEEVEILKEKAGSNEHYDEDAGEYVQGEEPDYYPEIEFFCKGCKFLSRTEEGNGVCTKHCVFVFRASTCTPFPYDCKGPYEKDYI